MAVLKQNPALHGGKEAADLTFLDTDDKEVIAFSRTKAENEIVVFINLSENQKEIKSDLAGNFKDFFLKSELTLNETPLTIPSNGFKSIFKVVINILEVVIGHKIKLNFDKAHLSVWVQSALLLLFYLYSYGQKISESYITRWLSRPFCM